MKSKEIILIVVAIALIIAGITLFFYPYISNYFYEKDVETRKEEFIENNASEENSDKLEDLYQELTKRNIELYENKQNNLVDPFSYEQSSIDLSEYGIVNNIIGYISIPKMDLCLPILLGANAENMRNGAAHLTETSYPIGGNNTNSVIAAHRSYSKATMFRYIDKLELGDKIYVQNFREELTYEVFEIKIIEPDDIEELYIQEGRDIITLITCHPYRVNTQRYVVKAERVNS